MSPTLKACLWFIMSYWGEHIKQLFWQGYRNCFIFWQAWLSPTEEEYEALLLDLLLPLFSWAFLCWESTSLKENMTSSQTQRVNCSFNVQGIFSLSHTSKNNSTKITLAHPEIQELEKGVGIRIRFWSESVVSNLQAWAKGWLKNIRSAMLGSLYVEFLS